ncbi:zinc-ribbon domain-containing protein, partial [Neobacillus drentensis]|uniref:zinc-ribbon domain-containing protein n=1 Tax=Neobacillus drentensis TaxID=220684 RepID=UPI003000526D
EVGKRILVNVEDLHEGASIKVTKICDMEWCNNRTTNQTYNAVMKSRKTTDGKDRCSKCGMLYAKESKKNNIKLENSLEYYAKENNKEYLLGEFSDKNKKRPNEISRFSHDAYLWKCPICHSEYPAPVSNRTKGGTGCPFCSSYSVNDTNCIATKVPWLANLFLNPEDANKYTFNSTKKADFKCPNCEEEIKNRSIRTVCRNGLSCPKCADGVSIPEKFYYNVLTQIGAEFEYQKTFPWSTNVPHENPKLRGLKRFDFYFSSLNKILEVHGAQHLGQGFEKCGGKTLTEEQENDKIKEEIARENGFNEEDYIKTDASKSTFDHLKNSMLNSKLSEMFDLLNVDWFKAYEYACGSLVRKAWDLWNDGCKNPNQISEILGVHNSTARKYLVRGTEINKCDYDPKKVQPKKRESKGEEAVVRLSLEGAFIDDFESAMAAARLFGIDNTNISSVCRGTNKTAGGYIWMLKDIYYTSTKEEIKKIVDQAKNDSKKRVVQLSLDGEFIDEFESTREAGRILGIDSSSIAKVCRREKLKKTGGFKWMFRDDYDCIRSKN